MVMQKNWDSADTETAIHRGNGNLLKDLRSGNLKGFSDARKQYNSTGKKRGHEYMHRGVNAPGTKSRYGSRYCAIEVTREMLNSPQVQTTLGKFDAGTETTAWIKNIPIVGDWYGFPVDASNPYGEFHKIGTACINLVTDGANLYIYSSYPSSFVGTFEVDLGGLFD